METSDKCGVTEEEAALLYGLAVSLRPRCIAEVGTGELRSLRAFSRAVEYMNFVLDVECHLWTCDIWDGPLKLVHQFGLKAKTVHGDSRALASVISPAPELIFIDGQHTCEAVKRDTEALWPVAADGALFIYHDITVPKFGLGPFLEEIGGVLIPTPRGMGLVFRGQMGD